MTNTKQTGINAELLAACEAALSRFKELPVTENAEIRMQLSAAITRAKASPSDRKMLDRPPSGNVPADPFARFRS